jgi:hypothetical protein
MPGKFRQDPQSRPLLSLVRILPSRRQIVLNVWHPVLKQLPLALDVAKFTEVTTVFGISPRDSCRPQARAFEINAMQKTMQSVK